VNLEKLIEKFSKNQHPIAVTGCKISAISFPSCEYDITIFDNKKTSPKIIEFENNLIVIHHGSLKESRANILVHYEDMKIIQDDQWELKMLASIVKEKKHQIYKNFIKDCLIDSLFCLNRGKNALQNSDPFGSAWIKSAAYFIIDAIFGFNKQKPSPSHTLEHIRKFKKTTINEKFSIINNCVGTERATPSLLSRMYKSTMGFSDMVESNGHSKIIQKKYEYFISNSFLSDCYFYLGYINRDNLMKIKDDIYRKPDLIHVLKVGFDLDNDTSKLEQQLITLQKTANELLAIQIP
jgi:hypothetical protein